MNGWVGLDPLRKFLLKLQIRFPICFVVNGRQYVAVGTGAGGTASHFMGLTPELRPSSGNNLFVFALPD